VSDGVSAGVLVVRSPYDGRELGRVPAGTVADVDAAVAAALARHREGPLPAHARATILDRAADQLAERVDDFARSISDEAAKPITAARVEATRAVDTFRFAAAEARTLTGETVPLDASAAGEGKVAFVLRIPRGVVGAITPFNFPLNLVAHKVAPAIAAGCPVVLKPAPNTPLTALRLAEALGDAGLPTGWLEVVTCDDIVAPRLVEHPDVAVISFTGSAAVGWAIAAAAPRKQVGLELGNNAPVIVEPDADVALAAAKVAAGGFAFSGQTCISVQRVYVHASVHDAFLAELVPRVEALVVGDPADPATDVSALITADDTPRVHGIVEAAVGGGARVVTGGRIDDRGLLVPTVVDGVTADMAICATEVFGPVVGVAAYETFDEAVALANDTRYGLQAAVFTRSLDRALDAAHRLEFGGVLVNEMPTFRADQMPYGGVKESGNTREGPAYAVEALTERRLVILQR
jgi:acyl-CoA reductase-like NAD-dependent aldehyde dehydrogenase